MYQSDVYGVLARGALRHAQRSEPRSTRVSDYEHAEGNERDEQEDAYAYQQVSPGIAGRPAVGGDGFRVLAGTSAIGHRLISLFHLSGFPRQFL